MNINSNINPINEIYWTRHQWAKACGFFLMRFANLETQVNSLKLYLNAVERIEKNQSGHPIIEPSKNWQSLIFEEKTEKILAQTKNLSFTKIKETEFKKNLNSLLLHTKELKDIRNTLAHGSFAMKDGHTQETPNFGIFSRTQKNQHGITSENAKCVHKDDLEKAISKTTDIEHGISSSMSDIVSIYELEKIDTDIDVPFEDRVHEVQLSLALGAFVVHMGEIEHMIHLVYQCILDPEYDSESRSPIMKLEGRWDALTLSQKLKDLAEQLPESNGNHQLRQVIFSIQDSSLIKHRNLLNHAKVCHLKSAETGEIELVAIRHTRQGRELIHAAEIKHLIATTAKYSDDLSEAVAIAQMALTKPFVPV